MKILHLTLKKKWFDMILSGIKKEEYREIKPYWNTRLDNAWNADAICFKNGYSKNAPQFTIELIKICKGYGKVEWGAPMGKLVYILKLGKLIT